MKSTPKSMLRALCVSMFAAIAFAVVPLYGLGHVHHVPDPAAFDAPSDPHPSGSVCLICRLAQDRAVEQASLEAATNLALAGAAEIRLNLWPDRGSAGPLTSRGPPSLS